MVLALMQKRALASLSTSYRLVISVVSLSEAVMVSILSWISNKKQSKIGSVFFEFMTRPIVCKRLKSAELDTINLIMLSLIHI